jgi:hypothetical protein
MEKGMNCLPAYINGGNTGRRQNNGVFLFF